MEGTKAKIAAYQQDLECVYQCHSRDNIYNKSLMMMGVHDDISSLEYNTTLSTPKVPQNNVDRTCSSRRHMHCLCKGNLLCVITNTTLLNQNISSNDPITQTHTCSKECRDNHIACFFKHRLQICSWLRQSQTHTVYLSKTKLLTGEF